MYTAGAGSMGGAGRFVGREVRASRRGLGARMHACGWPMCIIFCYIILCYIILYYIYSIHPQGGQRLDLIAEQLDPEGKLLLLEVYIYMIICIERERERERGRCVYMYYVLFVYIYIYIYIYIVLLLIILHILSLLLLLPLLLDMPTRVHDMSRFVDGAKVQNPAI
jgi:hypothetical protein